MPPTPPLELGFWNLEIRIWSPFRLPRLTVLLRVIPIPIDPVNPRENFGDGRVELRGNFSTHAAVLEEHARERFVFNDGNLVLLADLADLLSVQANPFGDDLRCAHGFTIISQRHSNV